MQQSNYTQADLEVLTIQYPYSSYYKMLYLKALKDAGDVRYLSLLGDAAISVYDRRVLYELLESEDVKERRVDVAEVQARPSAAPSFDIETALADRPSIVSGESSNVGNEIEDFLRSGGEFRINMPSQEEIGEDDETEPVGFQQNDFEEEPFSETLAKIYIKQKKYDKAIKTFRGLIARFPEKSVYFADQIRFLEKLISNL